MGKLKVALFILALLGLIAAVTFFLLGYFRPKGAGLLVESTPSSAVYLDGVQVGKTPYEVTRESGEVVVKLVPEAAEVPLSPYETKVSLTPGIKTIIRRELKESEEASSGEIISFEKIGGKEANIAIVSIPNNAQVSVDGQVRGFAPYKNPIGVGEHEIKIVAPGYKERILSIRAVSGYKLIIVVKLAPSGEKVEEETPIEKKEMLVEILTTPTGYLRVRSTPSTSAAEVAQVKPGEKFPFIEEDANTGWFKIEYKEGSQGWVTNQYAKKVEEPLVSPSPSPSPKAL